MKCDIREITHAIFEMKKTGKKELKKYIWERGDF
jgi:hypothetical protein